MSRKWIIPLLIIIAVVSFWQLDGKSFLIEQSDKTSDNNPNDTETKKEGNNPNGKEETTYLAKDLKYELEIISDNIEIPWEIVHLSKDKLLLTERAGKVILLDEGEVSSIHNVEHIGEGGLLGMAKSPNFVEDKQLFLYYTYNSDGEILNRVSRFTFRNNTLVDELYILDGIPGARFHNGGRLKFGPDEKLYITTGDARQKSLSQDIDSLAGKILRLNPDGTIPEDNPFKDNPVYAYGLRNPQGLAWHPITKELYASDHGPTKQDEINRILAGKNYGWPIVTCSQGQTEYEDPVVCYTDFTLAPSGIAFLAKEGLEEVPLYVAGLKGNMLMRIDLDVKGNFIRQEKLFTDYGRIRNVVCEDEYLYISTNNRDGRGTVRENDDIILRIKTSLPEGK